MNNCAAARRRLGIALAMFLCAALGTAGLTDAATPRDPLSSSQWVYMARKYFRDAPVVFDDRVQVRVPAAAENPRATPVQVRAPGLANVRRVLVFADQDSQTRVLDYYPVAAAPAIAFSFKVEQATPIRAAMRTADGVWHVGGAWIDAQGGGCSVPVPADDTNSTAAASGAVAGRLWARGAGHQRLKFSVAHAMDTGLIAGQPKTFIDGLRIEDQRGRLLARIVPTATVAADPVFTLELDHRGSVRIVGRDNHARHFRARIAAPGT